VKDGRSKQVREERKKLGWDAEETEKEKVEKSQSSNEKVQCDDQANGNGINRENVEEGKQDQDINSLAIEYSPHNVSLADLNTLCVACDLIDFIYPPPNQLPPSSPTGRSHSACINDDFPRMVRRADTIIMFRRHGSIRGVRLRERAARRWTRNKCVHWNVCWP
jgi:hypothetical protein